MIHINISTTITMVFAYDSKKLTADHIMHLSFPMGPMGWELQA